MTYATSVGSIREKMEITQAELAVRAGVNVSTVWRWESGGVPKRGPARAFLDALAKEAGYAGFKSPSSVRRSAA